MQGGSAGEVANVATPSLEAQPLPAPVPLPWRWQHGSRAC
jgi:hypothetical protein